MWITLSRGRVILSVLALLGAFLLSQFEGLIIDEAVRDVDSAEILFSEGKISLARLAEYLHGSAYFLMIGGFELGLIVAIIAVMACYRRELWTMIRNATIVAWLFVLFDCFLTFRIMG